MEWVFGVYYGIIYCWGEFCEFIKMYVVGGEGGGDLDFDIV